MAMSSVERIEAKTHQMHEIVEATIAEAKSTRDEVKSRVATLAVLADASAICTSEEIASRVQEVVAYSNVQVSRIAVDVTQ